MTLRSLKPRSRWRATGRTRATRLPSLRSPFSNRGALWNSLNHTASVYEATGEKGALYRYMANPDVVDIWEQPPAVRYRDANGVMRSHTFDLLVRLKCGTRIAVAVKPWDIAERKNFREELSFVAAYLPTDFADKVSLLTERDAPRWETYNAQLIHSVRRCPNPSAATLMWEIASTLMGATRIEELVAQSGLQRDGFRAVVSLIADGYLLAETGKRIDVETLVSRPTAH